MERRARWRPSNFAAPPTPLRVVDALGTDGGVASLYLYDAIDSWGGEWGISAAEFVTTLSGIQASSVDLHLNSPGGDLFEAVAMRAALAAHPAAVTVYIDGLAASAASVLATVGDKVIAAPGSQVMVHKASTIAIGNADDMRATAVLLAKADQDIAGFYAHRAGGSPAEWLAAMAAETWFSADEAVTAGLVDEVTPMGPSRADQQVAAAAPDRWIVAAWKYAGRDNAPAPPALPAAVVSNDEQPLANQAAPEQTPGAPAPGTTSAVEEGAGLIPPVPEYLDTVNALDVPGLGRIVFDPPVSVEEAERFRSTWNSLQTPAASADALPVETALPTAPTVNLSELLCSAIREGVTL